MRQAANIGSRKWMMLLAGAILAAGVAVVVLPMVYMISTALKPNGALYEYPPRFFPSRQEITLENFRYILGQKKFITNFFNSAVVSVTTVLGSAAVASALAFCIARFRFPGRTFLFSFIILTMIIPGTTMIVPQYELAVRLRAVNRLWGLIPFYIAWVIPYSTFMIKGFVESVPKELDEATYIDGGGVLTVYRHVILPLSKPGIASVSIFNFLTAWEEFPWANTVINDDAKRTLPIAISGFFGQHQFTQWGYVFALSVLSLIPILAVFLSCQRFFVEGLTAGSVKG
ncbi:carbohydrate ABC transporter permease [Lachnoclostridium sp. Marseille-P6806]|uniref:carbohydrate ABC transporter permease n=1 Tax=Lachnoclostridium sp. Marseille-P6806 TaxID=2364793 RepID=UPI001F5E6395|nr:carbohydrate ABC transporter permease [Lachnoclostridium sp. Marseille-P6806]